MCTLNEYSHGSGKNCQHSQLIAVNQVASERKDEEFVESWYYGAYEG